MEQSRSVISWFAFVVGLAVLLGGSIAAYQHTRSVQQLDAASSKQIVQLQNELASLRNTSKKQQEAISVETTGLSIERKEKDDKYMRNTLTQALTFKTGDEYIAARKKLAQRLHLPSDSQFLSVFMPGEKEGAWRTDASGKTYFAYNGVNMTLNTFSSSVTKIDGGDYSYFALVGLKTKSSDGKSENTSYATITYTMNNKGQVSNLIGWAGAPGSVESFS